MNGLLLFEQHKVYVQGEISGEIKCPGTRGGEK
jgi:hypothetical protein